MRYVFTNKKAIHLINVPQLSDGKNIYINKLLSLNDKMA